MPTSAPIHSIGVSRPDSLPAYTRGDVYPPLQTTTEPITSHVLDGQRTVLFGAGYAESVDELASYVDRIGSPDVVVEHGHPDHYDGVGELAARYDADVAIPKPDADALRNVDVVPDIELGHDEVRWVGIRIIHVPGHTPGNTTFLYEPTDTLITGDSVVHSASFIAAPGEWRGAFAPCVPELNADDEATRRNVERLLEYSVDSALVTHGPNVVGYARNELRVLLDDLIRAGGAENK